MKPKIRPIKDLWFRFVKGTYLETHINSQELAVVLGVEGLIILIPHKSEARIEHYRDWDPTMREELLSHDRSSLIDLVEDYLEARDGLT